MKRTGLLSLLAVLLCMFVGCGKEQAERESEHIRVLTTIYPVYDWVLNVGGDDIDASFLLDSGADLHNYQPTAADIAKIAQSDVFIYIGGESDEWVEDALYSAGKKDLITLNLSELLVDELKEEDSFGEEDNEEDEVEMDEHIWLSLRNAQKCVMAIAETLEKALPGHDFTSSASQYNTELNALDKQFSSFMETATRNTVLFADRFPFRYFMDDYEIHYEAAFSGCSAETEASFETITYLSGKIDEYDLPYVFILEGRDTKIAYTILQNAKKQDVGILTVDSMQTGSGDQDGYLAVMRRDVELFKEALQ